METINGKVFIIHQIGERETLYAISKRYGAPITSILEYNNTADAGLEIGQILKIPYVPKTKAKPGDATLHKVSPKETLYSIAKLYNVAVDDLKAWNNLKDGAISTDQELIVRKKGTTSTPITPVSNVKGKHTVGSGETLYSIARQYGVTVPQLMEWNRITGSEVNVGDVLTVAGTGIEQKTQTVAVGTSTVIGADTKPVEKENTIKISEAVTGSDEVKQSGLAELIEGTDGNRKYLALHRTAKTGTGTAFPPSSTVRATGAPRPPGASHTSGERPSRSGAGGRSTPSPGSCREAPGRTSSPSRSCRSASPRPSQCRGPASRESSPRPPAARA